MKSLRQCNEVAIVGALIPGILMSMLELRDARKNKINLADYEWEQDMTSRRLLSDFSAFDFKVLEEILFSPLKISIKKLCRSLDTSETAISAVLSKLSDASLLRCDGDTLMIDKERRKYFEFQILRFQDDFQPDMEFLQGLLKRVPIHILPTWYAIPRSSNNIFESIIEKYLATPQIYQRYLMELSFPDPVMSNIVQDVFASPDLRLVSCDLIAKYNLARHDFELLMLQLEFHLVCFVSYIREEDHWHEVVTPFHEWREYLLFLQEIQPPIIKDNSSVVRHRERDFAFVEDMGTLLTQALKKPIDLHQVSKEFPQAYVNQIVEKLGLIELAEQKDNHLHATAEAAHWLDLSLEKRALFLFRHQNNRLQEKNIKEAANTIKRVLHGDWVFFDDFIRGAIVPMSGDSVITLKSMGKKWKYTLPQYTVEEKALVKDTIFKWLFECGIVATGTREDRDCFAVTPFGRFFFED